MQITIVQSEIEKAIVDYIKGQVTVNDGMEIDIDLRATRGAEGFQAVIDIHPKGSGIRSKPAAPKGDGGSQTKPLKIAEAVEEAKATKPAKSPSKAKEKPTSEAAEPVTEPATEVEEAAPVQPAEPANEQEEVAAEAPAEAEPTAKVSSIFANKTPTETETAGQPAGERKSLFGDLKRPVNA